MKKENGISLIYIIIIIVALIAILITTTLILHSKFKNNNSDTSDSSSDISTVENKESKIEKLSEEDKYSKIAEQCGKKLVKNVSTLRGHEIEYIAQINTEDIEYTNKYSSDGEYYYLMTAFLNINAYQRHPYLVRCQWNEKTNKIENYGDNSALLETLLVLGDNFSKANKSDYAIFLARSNYYTNNDIWKSRDAGLYDDNTYTDLLDNLKNLKEIDFVVCNIKENTESFQSDSDKIFNEYITETKNLLSEYHKSGFLPITKIHLYVCIISCEDELKTSIDLTNYLPNTITMNDQDMDKFMNRLKQETLFYSEDIVF